MCVTADACTANFGNFGMRFNNLEPRIRLREQLRRWRSCRTDRAVELQLRNARCGQRCAPCIRGRRSTADSSRDGQVQGARAVHAGCVAWKPGAASSIARSSSTKTFDLPAAKPELQPYKEVSAAAVGKWEALIAATNGKSETYDPTVIPIYGGSTDFEQNRTAWRTRWQRCSWPTLRAMRPKRQQLTGPRSLRLQTRASVPAQPARRSTSRSSATTTTGTRTLPSTVTRIPGCVSTSV